MNKIIVRNLIIFFLIIFSLNLVYAKDEITLSINQSEYYFLVGQDAIININSENSYGQEISGMLAYTITQNINQGNFQYSSSNTQSTSFKIPEDESQIPISFGTSQNPMTLDVNLKFSYNDDGKDMQVNLDNIKIHFVNNESEQNNQQNTQSSSSQETSSSSSTSSSQNSAQDPMQQMLDEMLNQQNPSQDLEQQLQNNQVSQDSSALKEQIEKEMQEKQELEQNFQEELANNPEFQKEHQDLLSQGYNLTDGNFNPQNNNTGDFELNYEKPNGERASMKGSMNDGEISNLQKDTPQIREDMLNQLENNPEYQKYENQLQKEGYQKQDTNFQFNQNSSNLQMNYVNNQTNQSANINANFVNLTLKDVELNKEDEETKNKIKIILFSILLILLTSILAYYIYSKYLKKSKNSQLKQENQEILEKPFDYKKEAKKLIKNSEKSFENKEYKDAYSFASQAIRLYLSYNYHLNKELTNDDIINFLKERENKKINEKNYKREKQTSNKKSKVIDYREIKETFDLCSLVEFAKYHANKNDFDIIINCARKVIEN